MWVLPQSAVNPMPTASSNRKQLFNLSIIARIPQHRRPQAANVGESNEMECTTNVLCDETIETRGGRERTDSECMESSSAAGYRLAPTANEKERKV